MPAPASCPAPRRWPGRARGRRRVRGHGLAQPATAGCRGLAERRCGPQPRPALCAGGLPQHGRRPLPRTPRLRARERRSRESPRRRCAHAARLAGIGRPAAGHGGAPGLARRGERGRRRPAAALSHAKGRSRGRGLPLQRGADSRCEGLRARLPDRRAPGRAPLAARPARCRTRGDATGLRAGARPDPGPRTARGPQLPRRRRGAGGDGEPRGAAPS